MNNDEQTKKSLTLADVQTGEYCVIVRVTGHGSFRHRLMEMGFVRGEKIKVIRNAPLRDPIEYEIMGGHVSLRRIEAQRVEVVPVTEEEASHYSFHGTVTEETERILGREGKKINVALVGNPNCGKTSFFNHATGMREKVGNYSGVTVDSKVGYFKHEGYTIALADLPGTYSLTEYTPEELYVRQYIMDQHPDIVLNVADASNLERNLFLTTQLIDMNVPMVMALNMYDELEKNGDRLDLDTLSELFGFPIIPTVSSKGIGIQDVMAKVVDLYENLEQHTKHVHINYGVDLEKSIGIIKEEMREHLDLSSAYSTRYLAIELLAGDKVISELVGKFDDDGSVGKVADEQRAVIERRYNEDAATIVAGAKYGFVRGALLETYTQGKDKSTQPAYSADKILTNRWLGFPILVFFLWFMFQMTFTLGAYPQAWLESFFGWLGDVTTRVLPDGIVKDLLVDGIIAGVGGVCSFLPNILILFFFISILEDTGYMARAAFIMDKLMHKMGLHGKSFIPMIMGFGCNVPAIMATRTIEDRKSRLLTMLVIPMMSCSARIPVYVILVSAFFSHHAAFILTGLYLLGMIMAVLMAKLFSRFFVRGESLPFVMELPPYRMPTAKAVLRHTWEKGKEYLKKMGTIILGASIIVWALSYYPTNDNRVAQAENSYMARIGKAIEPAMRPCGFDWRQSVSLLAGVGAKEVVASTMAVVYATSDEEAEMLEADFESDDNELRISQLVHDNMTPLSAASMLLFILLYMPCVSTIVAIKNESGKWRWALFTMAYTIGLAWVVSTLFFQIGSLII